MTSWNEADHPRDEDGKFTYKNGGASTSSGNSVQERADILYPTMMNTQPKEDYNFKGLGSYKNENLSREDILYPSMKNTENIKYKRPTYEEIYDELTKDKYQRPVEGGRISSPFGQRIHPIKKVLSNHTGVDIAVGMNTPISAPMDGKVSRVEINGTLTKGYGKFIEINHGKDKNGNEIKTQYGHLNDWNVKVGDTVKKGQIIGKVGSTGGSTGAHLHFNVLKNGKYENPLNYIDAKNKFK